MRKESRDNRIWAALVMALIMLWPVFRANGAATVSTVQIPGELSKSNNLLFADDGRTGLVAVYSEQGGSAGHSLYTFDTATGALLSRLDTFPSGIHPTRLEMGAGNVLVVSARSASSTEAAFVIVPVLEGGIFDEQRRVSLAIGVARAEGDETIPDKVGITADGQYGIYTNKAGIFVFSTQTGRILFYEELIPVTAYAANNTIQGLDYDVEQNRLALIHRQPNGYRLLVYSIAADGSLVFENQIALPQGEIVGEGSTVAFTDAGQRVTIASSNTGRVMTYDVMTGYQVRRVSVNTLREADEDLASTRPVLVEHKGGLTFVQRPGHIQRPGHGNGKRGRNGALVAIDSNGEVAMNLRFDESFLGAALEADGSSVVALVAGQLQVYDLASGRIDARKRISQNSLNLSLDRTGLVGVVTTDGVQLVRLAK